MRVAGRVVERRRAPERAGELRRSVLDCSRAAVDLGWRARTGLEEGLARTMEYLGEESR
jgi:UDP-glucose 4-epimerase